jgi:hypothetical protein
MGIKETRITTKAELDIANKRFKEITNSTDSIKKLHLEDVQLTSKNNAILNSYENEIKKLKDLLKLLNDYIKDCERVFEMDEKLKKYRKNRNYLGVKTIKAYEKLTLSEKLNKYFEIKTEGDELFSYVRDKRQISNKLESVNRLAKNLKQKLYLTIQRIK